MWSLICGQLEAVPRRLVWDNEAGIGRRGHLAAGVAAFTGTLATKIVQLKPFDPESKGIVERVNRYLETSFLPGRVFESPADFNAQLSRWLTRANTRRVRAINARPVDLITEDRNAMHSLPGVSPAAGFATQTRLPRDYHLRVLGNDYSIDPTAIGRMIDLTADLEHVTARCAGAVVAAHPRSWATQQTITDAAHVQTAARLRADFQQPRSVRVETDGEDGLVRDLADYDTHFGVELDAAAPADTDGQVAV